MWIKRPNNTISLYLEPLKIIYLPIGKCTSTNAKENALDANNKLVYNVIEGISNKIPMITLVYVTTINKFLYLEIFIIK